MMYKVDWNDLSEVCATSALTDLAREKSGGKKALFITLNDVCDSLSEAAIVKLIEREYPDDIVYEELHETWGSGINAFVFGEELLGKGEDFDLEDIEDSLYDWLRDWDDIETDLELDTIQREWDKFAEHYNLDVNDDRLWENFMYYCLDDNSSCESIGYFGADIDWDKCYNAIMDNKK